MIDLNNIEDYLMPPPVISDDAGYIYFLFYKSILVYIGQTKDVDIRVREHRKTKVFDSIKVTPFQWTKKERVARETELIEHFQPILNKNIKNDSAPNIVVIEDALFRRNTAISLKIENDKLFAVNGEQEGIIVHGAYLIKFGITISWYNLKNSKSGKFYHNGHINDIPFIFDYDGDEEWTQKNKLPNSYVFPFGKYVGEMVEDVRAANPQYIEWFEANIPLENRKRPLPRVISKEHIAGGSLMREETLALFRERGDAGVQRFLKNLEIKVD